MSATARLPASVAVSIRRGEECRMWCTVNHEGLHVVGWPPAYSLTL